MDCSIALFFGLQFKDSVKNPLGYLKTSVVWLLLLIMLRTKNIKFATGQAVVVVVIGAR